MFREREKLVCGGRRSESIGASACDKQKKGNSVERALCSDLKS